MNKKRRNQQQTLLQSPYLTITLPTLPGCTGYTIYGIAPIPVRIDQGEQVRIEPTTAGYNVWEIEERR